MATSDLTEQLLKLAAAPPTMASDAERQALMAACEKAKSSLETPLEATVRFMFGTFQSVSLCLGVDMGLLDLGIKAGGPITAEELAEGSGADAVLIVRIMRILVTMGLFDEVSNNTYTATPLASTWATGSPLREAVIHIASQLHPVTALPEYFEEKGYRNPTDAEDSPWQYTYQSKQSFYDWLSQRPKVQAAFNTTMAIARHGRGEEWFEYYPVAEKLSRQTADPEAILLVDIGGNVGHDIINFHDHFPKIPGRLVFVDQPSVISSAKDLPKGIEGIAHDIFHPYPPSLRNTKAYYLRNVLHDFPDAQALQILSHIHSSMGKDSVLLIDENALPDADVSFYAASLDLIMMSVFASLERTVGQFEELLGAAGFEVVGMWRSKEYGPGSGTLFEAVLKG